MKDDSISRILADPEHPIWRIVEKSLWICAVPVGMGALMYWQATSFDLDGEGVVVGLAFVAKIAEEYVRRR